MLAPAAGAKQGGGGSVDQEGGGGSVDGEHGGGVDRKPYRVAMFCGLRGKGGPF